MTAARTAPPQNVGHLASDWLLSVSVFVHVVCLSVKDVESTSGSGPESFYTPEPSPTDRDSSSSGRVCKFIFIQLCLSIYVLLMETTASQRAKSALFFILKSCILITIVQRLNCSWLCVVFIFVSSPDKPVRGSTPVFEFVDPDIQVRVHFSV